MRALLMTFVGIRSGWLKSVQAGVGSDGHTPAKASVAKTGSSADGAVGTLSLRAFEGLARRASEEEPVER
eukprot:4022856-Amphidinium_carterae.1